MTSSAIDLARQEHGFPETADIETASADYARRFAGKVGSWFLDVQEQATLQLLAPYQAGATVLDVGGGHGQVVGPLLDNGFQVTVTGSAQICRQRIEQQLSRPGCSFKVVNILDLPFPDRSFEVVLTYRLLSHVSRWKLFLEELTRVARSAVVIDYPSSRSWNFLADAGFTLKRRLEGNTRPYRCFSPTTLDRSFRDLGFVSDERYPEFFLPMVLHRWLKSVRLSASLEELFRALNLTDWFGSPVVQRYRRER